MNLHKNQKGQAIVEMALFGSFILIIFATLLSYIQRMNEQQYVQMETFRNALYLGNTYTYSNGKKGTGASVQFTNMQTRKLIDLSGGFRKGSNQTISSSANVYWAQPKVGETGKSLVAYKVNEDKLTREYKYFFDDYDEDEDQAKKYFMVQSDTDEQMTDTDNIMKSTAGTEFSETSQKKETTSGITNINKSNIKETVHTYIPYTIREKSDEDNDEDADTDTIVKSGIVWDLTQNGYRDSDGQYKYKATAASQDIEREREWSTDL